VAVIINRQVSPVNSIEAFRWISILTKLEFWVFLVDREVFWDRDQSRGLVTGSIMD
jgi:hypothetical protein